MHIVVVGLNNKTAPVSIREQVSFGEHEMKGAVVALRDEKVFLKVSSSRHVIGRNCTS